MLLFTGSQAWHPNQFGQPRNSLDGLVLETQAAMRKGSARFAAGVFTSFQFAGTRTRTTENGRRSRVKAPPFTDVVVSRGLMASGLSRVLMAHGTSAESVRTSAVAAPRNWSIITAARIGPEPR